MGLSPRVRGNRDTFLVRAGVYPRVCGGTKKFINIYVTIGSIPACAGEPRKTTF